MKLSTLAKYPFLNESKTYVKNDAPLIEELLDDPLYERARIIGVERLDNAFKYRDVKNEFFYVDERNIYQCKTN